MPRKSEKTKAIDALLQKQWDDNFSVTMADPNDQRFVVPQLLNFFKSVVASYNSENENKEMLRERFLGRMFSKVRRVVFDNMANIDQDDFLELLEMYTNLKIDLQHGVGFKSRHVFKFNKIVEEITPSNVVRALKLATALNIEITEAFREKMKTTFSDYPLDNLKQVMEQLKAFNLPWLNEIVVGYEQQSESRSKFAAALEQHSPPVDFLMNEDSVTRMFLIMRKAALDHIVNNGIAPNLCTVSACAVVYGINNQPLFQVRGAATLDKVWAQIFPCQNMQPFSFGRGAESSSRI
jgi:hypothetical protein